MKQTLMMPALPKVFESGGIGTSTAELEEVADNCTSIKEEEQLVVISKVSKGVVSWETAELFTIPRSTKKTGVLICNTIALEHKAKASAIRKELKVGQASFAVLSEESSTALNKFETIDLKKKVQFLGRAFDTIGTCENTSDCSKVDAVSTSVVRLAGSFCSYNEVVETFSGVYHGEGEKSDVTHRQKSLAIILRCSGP